MAIIETVEVEVVLDGWEGSSMVPRNNVVFGTGAEGLQLIFLLDRAVFSDHLAKKLRALDLGATATIRLSGGGPSKCSFENAVVTSKEALIGLDEDPNGLLMATAEAEGYPGIIKLAFHVGPILKRE